MKRQSHKDALPRVSSVNDVLVELWGGPGGPQAGAVAGGEPVGLGSWFLYQLDRSVAMSDLPTACEPWVCGRV